MPASTVRYNRLHKGIPSIGLLICSCLCFLGCDGLSRGELWGNGPVSVVFALTDNRCQATEGQVTVRGSGMSPMAVDFVIKPEDPLVLVKGVPWGAERRFDLTLTNVEGKMVYQGRRIIQLPQQQTGPLTVPLYRHVINCPVGLIDMGDGTVWDELTHLTWMKCDQGWSWDGEKGCIDTPGVGNLFQYCSTASHACDDETTLDGGGQSSAYDSCQALNTEPPGGYAGYTDWRVPTKDEFKSLVYCSNGAPLPLMDFSSCEEAFPGKADAPTIDTAFFPSTALGYYWTASAFSDNDWEAWYLHFGNGRAHLANKESQMHLRCVR